MPTHHAPPPRQNTHTPTVPYWHAGCTVEPLRTLFDTWGWHVGAIEGVAHDSLRGARADAAARELCRLADSDIDPYL